MDLNSKLNLIPNKPGCYLMKDKMNEVIYVGKAKNLYNRVRSYFTGVNNLKNTKLVENIVDIEYIITSNETEAFLLEISLIKKYDPKYNIALTDDKTYPYILVTEEKHPRILYTRNLNYKGKFYGPYPNAASAREVADILNAIFPLRKCKKLPKEVCLYYHIGQCLAPCVNKDINEDSYITYKKEIDSILTGNINEEVKTLKQKMNQASLNLEYEKALSYKKSIDALENLKIKQAVSINIVDTDVFGYALEDGSLSIQVFHIRKGMVVERDGALLDVLGNFEDVFSGYIDNFYFYQNNPLPKQILIPNLKLDFFNKELNKLVFIPKKGKKKDLLELACKNSLEKLEFLKKKKESEYQKTIVAMNELSKLLGYDNLRTIEAFDNSNLLGTNPVSAMVYFKDGNPVKDNYRKYKVKYVEGANDVATMQEVVYRRYLKLRDEEKEYPDLIVIDGGKAQVDGAVDILKQLRLSIPVIGLVKDKNHKTDRIYYQDKEITISKNGNLFKLLERVQEEVHRFAITFFRKTQRSNFLITSLDDIKGLSNKQKQEILKIIGDEDFRVKLDEMKLKEDIELAVLDALEEETWK
jgi:excinuclease ABC subunit C